VAVSAAAAGAVVSVATAAGAVVATAGTVVAVGSAPQAVSNMLRTVSIVTARRINLDFFNCSPPFV
jgi:hypothetical protein